MSDHDEQHGAQGGALGINFTQQCASTASQPEPPATQNPWQNMPDDSPAAPQPSQSEPTSPEA